MITLELGIAQNNIVLDNKYEGDNLEELKGNINYFISNSCIKNKLSGELYITVLFTENGNYLDSDDTTVWVGKDFKSIYYSYEDYREFEENKKVIKIKFFNDTYDGDNSLKNIGGNKSDWIDLRASEKVVIGRNQFKMIPLGVAMKLPDGYEALIVPRSSLFKNWGIIQTNSMGVIDESYCGNEDQWHFPAYCLEPKNGPVTIIEKGERLCQFRIIEHQPKIKFDVKDVLDSPNRGGFGSTGSK